MTWFKLRKLTWSDWFELPIVLVPIYIFVWYALPEFANKAVTGSEFDLFGDFVYVFTVWVYLALPVCFFWNLTFLPKGLQLWFVFVTGFLVPFSVYGIMIALTGNNTGSAVFSGLLLVGSLRGVGRCWTALRNDGNGSRWAPTNRGALIIVSGVLLVSSAVIIWLTAPGLFYPGREAALQAGGHFGTGYEDYKSGDDQKAEQELKQSIKYCNSSPGLWMQKVMSLTVLGQVYLRHNRDSEAESCFTNALHVMEQNEDSEEFKSNQEGIRDFCIQAMQGKAALLRKDNRSAEASEVEAKASTLTSKRRRPIP